MQVYEEIKKKFRWREAEDTTVFSPSSSVRAPGLITTVCSVAPDGLG